MVAAAGVAGPSRSESANCARLADDPGTSWVHDTSASTARLPGRQKTNYARCVLKLPPFAYLAPSTLDDALSLLSDRGDEARVLAGGQSLIPLLALRLARPECLVDLGRLTELVGIADHGPSVGIGAMTKELMVERSAVVAAQLPLLAQALSFIGHPAIRSRGTVGGSLAHADPAAELPAAALVLEAEMRVVSRDRGPRVIPAKDFFLGPFTTALASDEILTEVRIPKQAPGSGFCFDEVARRVGDFAVVGAAAAVQVQEGQLRGCRVTLTGVADRPILRTGVELGIGEDSVDSFSAAGQRLAQELNPPSDLHGSSEYRRHLVALLVPQVLGRAHQVALAGSAS